MPTKPASKTTAKKKTVSRKTKSTRLPKPLVKILVVAAIFVGFALMVIYQVSDRPTREKIQEAAVLNLIDPIRDSAGTPEWAALGLDAWADSFSKVEASWTALTKPISEAHRKYLFAGLPSSKTWFRVLQNEGYMVGYDEKRKNPAWVGFRLFQKDDLRVGKRPSDFKEDSRTHAQVSPADYLGSGYDRGHMAPNYAIALCYGREAQFETFLMSNIVPQLPQLNRGPWKNLEHRQAQRMAQRLGEIWVLVGPIYSKTTASNTSEQTTSTHLKNGVEIPIAFFNIVVQQDNSHIRALAFIMPQRATADVPFSSYLTTIDQVESLTNLDFFSELPDNTENHFESIQAPWLW